MGIIVGIGGDHYSLLMALARVRWHIGVAWLGFGTLRWLLLMVLMTIGLD